MPKNESDSGPAKKKGKKIILPGATTGRQPQKKKSGKLSPAMEWKELPSEAPAAAVDPSSEQAEPETIDAHFDPDTNSYYRRNETADYQKAPVGSIARYLKKLGYSAKVQEGESLSPKDRAIEFIETDRCVDYAGPLAGFSVGLRKVKGRPILVTNSPRLIEPKKGEWENLKNVFDGLLGAEQSGWLYAWLKIGIEALRAERQRPGQALVIAGPPSCGKSLCQALITELLGGREAKPYAAMTGRTEFNSELFAAEHLTIEDEAASADPRIRKTFGAEIKKLTVNRAQRCHKKNREALTLFPFWRVSITLNDDAAALQVLPQLEDGIRDKLMLMKAAPCPLPVDTSLPEGEEILWKLLTDELPAFVEYLLNRFEIPAGWIDSRFGVIAFHNPALLELMDATSDEFKLLELIDMAELWDLPTSAAWEGKAAELEELLIEKFGATARKLFSYNSACGQLLAFLREKTNRVDCRSLHGYKIWTIQPAAAESPE